MSATSLQALLESSALIEIEDSEEETFLLFSESIPSQNLGFVDSKATVLDLTVNGRDLTIHQSPTILSSTRDGGTTGAVVWKITPLISAWLLSPFNPLQTKSIINTSTTILELGCGISGITALNVAPKIGTYILTDQQYIMKYLHQNLLENRSSSSSSSTTSKSNKKGHPKPQNKATDTNILTFPLDWETSDIPSTLVASNVNKIDIILACDCIYNSHLVNPLVTTCANLCKFKLPNQSPANNADEDKETTTICIIAQQLRSPEIFEEWLRAFMREFRVWRVDDEALIEGLRAKDGFVVHVGVLK